MNKTKYCIIACLRRSNYSRNQLGSHADTVKKNCKDRVWKNSAQPNLRDRLLIQIIILSNFSFILLLKSISFFFLDKTIKIFKLLACLGVIYRYGHVLKHSYLSSIISTEAWFGLQIEKNVIFHAFLKILS